MVKTIKDNFCRLLFFILICCAVLDASVEAIQQPMAGHEAFCDQNQHPNNALENYYGEILTRHQIIPPLQHPQPRVPGDYSLGISLLQNNPGGPAPWNHAIYNPVPPGVPGHLQIQQKAQMALDRENLLDIEVNFGNPQNLINAALGLGIAPEIDAALRAGGYDMPLAASIFKLQHNVLNPPNFVGPNFGQNVGGIIVHFHLKTRVSKNMKELSHNIEPIVGYPSIQNMISNQYALAGQFVPSRAILVSYDKLQQD